VGEPEGANLLRTPPPGKGKLVVVSRASFADNQTRAPDSVAAAFGVNLAAAAEEAPREKLPETLGRLAVRVRENAGTGGLTLTLAKDT
jgi:uncharacterized protein (TIGR03437 family)